MIARIPIAFNTLLFTNQIHILMQKLNEKNVTALAIALSNSFVNTNCVVA